MENDLTKVLGTAGVILAGSFVLTIVAAAVRWWAGRLDVSSLADLVLALIAYQISILSSSDALKAMVSGVDAQRAYSQWGYALLGVSALVYVCAVHPGEVLWTRRHQPPQINLPDWRRHNLEIGFLAAWLLPATWVGYHLALFVGSPQ